MKQFNGSNRAVRRDMYDTQFVEQQTMQLSTYPSRKQRRPQKKRQFGWLQMIVALFICVILLTALGLGGYLTNDAGDNASKYDELPASGTDTASAGEENTGNESDDQASDNEGGTDPTQAGEDGQTSSDEWTGSDADGSAGADTESPTAPSIPTSDHSGSHIVAKGETLYSIAMAYYGEAKYMDILATANNISDPSHVEVGTKLVLPPKQ